MERDLNLDGVVLIIEDNFSLRTALTNVLEEEYPVVTASNGAAAVRLLEGPTRPALIILDLMMPIMSGWDVLTFLQRDPMLASIPVLVLSAIAEERDRQPNVPVAAIMPKPIDVESLLAVVARLYPQTPPRSMPAASDER